MNIRRHKTSKLKTAIGSLLGYRGIQERDALQGLVDSSHDAEKAVEARVLDPKTRVVATDQQNSEQYIEAAASNQQPRNEGHESSA
eukprot:CAMPEP_0114560144 /NCGR_PEP_ID=MMETSP0114-20121206/11304_1 /TAXON_ID=31324 /ORGANISM="Goniomonas sp, Strain m" /LENGTH=85 /DNA_ID=CAMNT_0001745673 /DNA_START=123 /DNA_END=380 /DNA_ORIENTATION=+